MPVHAKATVSPPDAVDSFVGDGDNLALVSLGFLGDRLPVPLAQTSRMVRKIDANYVSGAANEVKFDRVRNEDTLIDSDIAFSPRRSSIVGDRVCILELASQLGPGRQHCKPFSRTRNELPYPN